MKFIYDDHGRVIGKFMMKNAVCIDNNQTHGDSRWIELFRTAKGSYVLAHMTIWQGEENVYSLISKDEVIELMEKWGDTVEYIRKWFPDYNPVETV